MRLFDIETLGDTEPTLNQHLDHATSSPVIDSLMKSLNHEHVNSLNVQIQLY